MPLSPRLLRPRAAGSFDPRSIANCTAWFDANNASTVTLNGSTVSAWSNLVSGVAGFSQTTAANQPDSGTLGSRGAIVFPAGNTVGMTGPTVSAICDTTNNVITLFFVVQQTGSGSSSNRFFGTSRSTNWGWWMAYPGFNNAYWDFPEATARTNGPIGSTTIRTAQTICRLVRSGSLASQHYNGVQISSRSDASGSISAVAASTLGLWSTDSASYACGELLAFSRELSATETQTIERWLGSRWGVTL